MKKQALLVTVICVLLVGGALFSPKPAQANLPVSILSGQQNAFLNALQKQNIPVSIYLVNGIKLMGHVESFDGSVIFLKNSVTQMVYIHAISTVVPGSNVEPQP